MEGRILSLTSSLFLAIEGCAAAAVGYAVTVVLVVAVRVRTPLALSSAT